MIMGMLKRARAGVVLVIAIVPIVLYSSSTGPVIRVSGAPGDATCNQGGCHAGPEENNAGGSVVLTLAAGGNSYVPGQRKVLTLKITDARAKVFGFQMSARLDSNPLNGQAGTFVQDSHQKVICDNSVLRNDTRGCPSIYPVEFLEHNLPYQTGTVSVTWTAPAFDVGPVTIYVAANAANGDGGDGGDHIYTTTLRLTPPPRAPSISTNGVVSATAFKPNAGAAPGTLLEIYGQNLASTARAWQESDFQLNRAPTVLDQVKVAIDGKDAYVAYVSPGQVNIEVPDGVATGAGVPVVVTNSAGSSVSYPVTVSGLAPAILAPSSFAAKGTQYAAAILADASFAAPVAVLPGVTTRPATPGEVLVLYGIGLGPVTPSSPAGTLASGTTTIARPLQVMLGQTAAQVQYAGLAPGYTGLFQINVQVPPMAPGDYPLTLILGDLTVNTGALVSIGP